MITEDSLELIQSTFGEFLNDDGTMFAETGMYFHPRFPNHTPVFCGTFFNTYHPLGIFLCALEYGTRYSIPVFNHVGISAEGTPCDWYGIL